ncbi:MAG: very short patch repair endonuclease [Lachnospiraceae bacterium]|nr:very short patch repair endonuclease [Lachnospiraceae bacterium]
MKHPKSYDTDRTTSQRMSKIKLKHGDAEVKLAKLLWNIGYRYRLNYRKLPGSPDIAILRYHIAVFVDGEFWHGFDWDKRKTKLKRNREYWIEKIEENMERDIRNNQELLCMGWTPIHFWSKEVMKNTEECVRVIAEQIFENTIQDVSDGSDELSERDK